MYILEFNYHGQYFRNDINQIVASLRPWRIIIIKCLEELFLEAIIGRNANSQVFWLEI